MQTADILSMEHEYQRMSADERLRHHDDLRDEGFEWCPECGTALVWDLPEHCEPAPRTGRAPVITGDCPPLTAEQLEMTAPAPY